MLFKKLLEKFSKLWENSAVALAH